MIRANEPCDSCPALSLNGKQWSTRKKRERIALELGQMPDASDRAIARRLGVDHKTVGAVRTSLVGEFPHPRHSRRLLDYYPTPLPAIRALIERERFSGLAWEPAEGDSRIVKLMRQAGYDVFGSNLQDGVDFLETNRRVDHVVTNPPFRQALEFVLHAKKCAKKKIAMLLTLEFLSGQKRYEALFSDNKFPLARVYVFSRRIQFHPRSETTSAVTHAWYIWQRELAQDYRIPVVAG